MHFFLHNPLPPAHRGEVEVSSFVCKFIGGKHLYVAHCLYKVSSGQLTILVFVIVFVIITSSPKGNDAHLRAIIQSDKKWKHQFFRRLRAANYVVHGRIWLNFKLIQALIYVIITCKYEKDPINNNREKVPAPFFKL